MPTIELLVNRRKFTDIAESGSLTSCKDDSPTASTPAPQHQGGTMALENIHIGPHTASDVVKNLEKLFGHELMASVIGRPDQDILRLFIEPAELPDVESTPSPTPYDITDSGYFHTNDVRHGDTKFRLRDNKFISFSTKFSTAPSVIAALTEIEADRYYDVRAHAWAHHVQPHVFQINLTSWATTQLYKAACQWFAVQANHPLFQVGKFLKVDKLALKEGKITFATPYESPPKVVVWLSLLEFAYDRNERIMAFATDITETGFTAHMNSWGDTIAHQALLSWFAYPVGTPGICSGEVDIHDNAGVVTFDKKFNKPPRRVFVAINKLDTAKTGFCRFKVIHEAVSEMGMGVRIETWGNSELITSGASYLAIE